MYFLSDSPIYFEASRLSCPPLRSTQTECNCAVKLMCLQCHLRLFGTVQSAILFPHVAFLVIAHRQQIVPLWQRINERAAGDFWRCAWHRDDESSCWCEVSVCDGPHTHTGQCAASLWSACCLSALGQPE